MANLHISILVMTCGKRKAVTKSTAMTHKHPLQHPAHKNTPPCTSACFRAQLGPRRGVRSSMCTRSKPYTSPAAPSRCSWYPCTEQAGNLRTKYGKDIITTLTPENTEPLFSFPCCAVDHTWIKTSSPQAVLMEASFMGEDSAPTTTKQELLNLCCLFPKLSLPFRPH